MATISKAATGTNLAAGASWTGGVVPTTGDTARWLTSSLGPGLTGALTVDGIIQDGATGNIAHAAGTTITLGSAGFTQTSTNNRVWNESGVWAVGAVDQDWYLASPTAGTAGVQLQATSGLTGTATITLRNNTGTSDASRAGVNVYGANTGFTGRLALQTEAGLFIYQAGVLTACDISVEGNSARIMPGGGATPSFGSSSKTLTFNADGGMGFNGRALTCNSTASFGNTLRTVTLADDVTFAGPIVGTAGFAIAKADAAWSRAVFSNTSNTISGPVTIGNYIWLLAPVSTFNFANVTTFNTDGNWRLAGETTGGFTAPYTFASGTTFSGGGAVDLIFAASNLVTFPSGSLTGLTGTLDPATTYAANIARSGLILQTAAAYVTGRQAYAAVNDLPARVNFQSTPSLNTACTGRLYYVGGGAEYTNTRIDMVLRDTSFPAQNINEIYANCSDSNALIIGGGVKRFGLSATQTLTLRGTSTAENTISGTIDQNSLGALNITKNDAGKWVLAGTNTHTGTTTISSGTLAAKNNSALGSSAAGDVTVSAGGTLEISAGYDVNKGVRTFSLTSDGITPTLTSPTGTNSLTCGGVTLNSNVIIDTSLNASLVLNNSAAITGASFGFTKSGLGTLSLASTANTYSGVINVATGTLEVSSLNNQSANGVFGNSSFEIILNGTLKYSGATTSSTNRSLTLSGSSPTLDASGVGTATYSAATQSAESKVVTFTGTGTGNNTASFDLGDNSGTTGIAKSGAGKWVLSGATLNYTGATTIYAGTLNMGSTSRTLSGGVVISGGTLENGTATIDTNVAATGGRITAVLTGTGKTFDATSGTTTINPSGATASNSFTGTSTISSGATVRLYSSTSPSTSGNGKALGDSNVVVNGKIETAYSTTQKGQIRFGGNVTFGNGSQISIGAVA